MIEKREVFLVEEADLEEEEVPEAEEADLEEEEVPEADIEEVDNSLKNAFVMKAFFLVFI